MGESATTSTDYTGTYTVVEDRRLVRQGDGYELEIKDTRRRGRGHTPTYLQDITQGRYLSNLYQRPDGAEFEYCGLRYVLVRQGGDEVRIEVLYKYRRGGSARMDREPVRRDRHQLSLFN